VRDSQNEILSSRTLNRNRRVAAERKPRNKVKD